MDAALELVKLASEVRRLLDHKAMVTSLQPQCLAYRLGFVPKTYFLEGELAKQRAEDLRRDLSHY